MNKKQIRIFTNCYFRYQGAPYNCSLTQTLRWASIEPLNYRILFF